MSDTVNIQTQSDQTINQHEEIKSWGSVADWDDIITYPDERNDLIESSRMPPMDVVDTASLPPDLRKAPCWIHWRWVLGKGGKWTKTPCNELGRMIDSVNRSLWHSIEFLEMRRQNRLARIEDSGNGLDALGFAFAFDGGKLASGKITTTNVFWGLDIDNCVVKGELLPGALRIVQAMGSYAEISPTGTGIKIIFEGVCPLTVSQIALQAPGDNGTTIYGTIDVKRRGFFTITGRRVKGSVLHVTQASVDVLALLFGDKALDPDARDSTPRDFSFGGRHDLPPQDYGTDPELLELERKRLLPAVKEALKILKLESPQHTFHREEWLRVLMSVKSCGFDEDTELQLCDEFSRNSPKYQGVDDIKFTLESLKRTQADGNRRTVGSLFWEAAKHGFVPPSDYVPYTKSAREDFGPCPLKAVERWDTPVRIKENMLRLEEMVDQIFLEMGRYGWPVSQAEEVPGLSAEALPIDRRIFVSSTGELAEVAFTELTDDEVNAGMIPDLQVRPFHKDTMPGVVSRVVELQREVISKRDGTISLVPTEPKDRLIKHITSVPWPPHIRRIRSIISSPTMVQGGRVITQPGYDEASQIVYHDRGDKYIGLDRLDCPTQEDAQQAAAELIDLLRDYEFAGENCGVGHATWLSSVLTLVGFHYINGRIPLFAFDAPREAAGKSKLCRLASIIANTPAKMANYQSAEELGKSLPLLLQSVPRMVQFDNISPDALFGGPAIESLLTEGEGEFRVITSSKILKIKLATVFFATGNRMRLTQDMRRRTLKANLLTNSPNPEKRTDFFYKNLTGYAFEHRHRLLVNALIILRAWHIHVNTFGLPVEVIANRISNFPEWCDVIRGAVMFADPGPPEWASEEKPWLFDPAVALVSAGGEDMSELELQALTACNLIEALIAEKRKDDPECNTVCSKDIKVMRAEAPMGSELEMFYAAFDEAFELRAMSASDIGRAFARIKGRTLDDGRQLHDKVVRGLRKWQVRKVV